MAGRTGRSAALLLLGLLASTGCQSTTSNTSTSANGDAAATAAALRPADRDEGGLLLRTGSIMLGPGVGRNQWRWLGDGQWGF
jgi:hypothetical protein